MDPKFRIPSEPAMSNSSMCVQKPISLIFVDTILIFWILKMLILLAQAIIGIGPRLQEFFREI